MSKQGQSSSDTPVRNPLHPDKPLDQTIVTLLEQARRTSNGFALNVSQDLTDAEGKKVTFEVKPFVPVHDEWEPPAPYRAHTIEDAESLVTYATKYGTKDKSLIVFNDATVTLCLDEQVATGQREKAVLSFAYSADWLAWADLLGGKKMAHRDLLTFIILKQHNLKDPSLLDAMRKIRATATVDVESDIRLEKNEVGVVFKATAGDELLKFPRALTLSLPVLDKDVDDEASWQDVEIRVEITLPQEPKQPVIFQLLAPTLGAIRRGRITDEVATIREGLDGWTIVRGTHSEEERTLGSDE